MTYKNWNLNLFFNGAFGADRLNLARFTMASMVGDSRFITLREAYTDNFDKVGQSAIYPGLKVAGNNYQAVSTKWVEDASYVRLENISLSYNLSKKVTKFADIRLTLSCQNLFTITGYKGMIRLEQLSLMIMWMWMQVLIWELILLLVLLPSVCA